MISRTVSWPWRMGNRRGFTLIELIVALAVISVAAMVYFSFFGSSLVIGRTARNRTIVMQVAEDQMQAIQRHPESYIWKIPGTPDTQQFPVLLSEEDPAAGNPVDLPSAMPVEKYAREREEILYDSFRWQAWGRLPAPDATSCELTVAVHWKEGQREEVIALTSAVTGSFLPVPVAAPLTEEPPGQPEAAPVEAAPQASPPDPGMNAVESAAPAQEGAAS